jgi:hypothetical protein
MGTLSIINAAVFDGVSDGLADGLSASESEKWSLADDHLAALGHAEAGLALCDGAEGWDAGAGEPLSELRAARVRVYRSLLRARALLSRLGRRAEARGRWAS